MKRLTDARRSRCIFCEAADAECAFAAGEFSAPCPDYRRYQRLADIEDILGDDYDLNRLKELVQADREGRCEIHAAKDGATVYSIFLYVNGLHSIRPNGDPLHKIAEYEVNEFTRNTVDREFGKTVFLTREEAEAALEKMKEGDK